MGIASADGTTTIVDPDVPRRKFIQTVAKNDYTEPGKKAKFLTIKEAINVADSIEACCHFNNRTLRDRVFEDLSGTLPGQGDHPMLFKTDFAYAMLTTESPMRLRIQYYVDLGDPRINYANQPGSSEPFDPGPGGIGTMILHERMHWNGVANSSSTPEREGPAYGIEYYLARRARNEVREKQIIRKGEWAEGPAGHYRFCLWAFHMKWCHDVAEGRLTVHGVTSRDAIECITQFITDGEPISWGGTVRGKAHLWAADQVNLHFGIWKEGAPLPGVKPGSGEEYKEQCRQRISFIMTWALI